MGSKAKGKYLQRSFYNEIAKPFLASLTEEIEFTWFNIKDFETPLLDSDKNNDNKLIPLFKILSPTHILKLPFANDSNTLDKGFKDKHVSGRVTGINQSVDAANKSVVVHAVLNNVALLNLIAGQYVSGLIQTGNQLVSAVPKDAIVKANDKSYIFVFEGIEKEPIKRDQMIRKSIKMSL